MGLRRAVQIVITIGVFSLGGALLFIIGMLVHSLGTASFESWEIFRDLSIAFALLGAMYGTIVALDSTSDFAPSGGRWLRTSNALLLRTVLCSALGTALVAFMQSWHSESLIVSWVLVGAVVGAVLGWLGWRWAKYVDF